MSEKSQFLFGSKNYIILIISILLILFGFVLMIGGGVTETDFNPEIFSNQRIKIAPFIIILGYIGAIFSIFYND